MSPLFGASLMGSQRGCWGMIVSMIRVTVNGDAQRFDAPLDVAALLARLDCKGRKVAVERNGEIVPRSAHGSTLIETIDRKSTRLNSSHLVISYAVFCLKKKK